jgi:hypothetical protein
MKTRIHNIGPRAASTLLVLGASMNALAQTPSAPQLNAQSSAQFELHADLSKF